MPFSLIFHTHTPWRNYFLERDGDQKSNLRSKLLSGKLYVTIKGAREFDHAPIVTARSRSAAKQGVDTYVSLKVEGTPRARTHPSRTDRWNEDFEITVDKANEVEIAVYDKQVSEPHPVPIGLLWIGISDLVEALRRQKVLMESGQGGWVTAGDMNKSPGSPSPGALGHGSTSSGDYNAPLNFNASAGPGGAASHGSAQAEGIDGWFAVEPAGALALHLNFGQFHAYRPLLYKQTDCCILQSRRTFGNGLWTHLVALAVKVLFANARMKFMR